MAKILILEDDNFFNEDLKLIIEDEGHVCTVFDNTDDILKNMTILEGFDLMILDLMMIRGESLKDDKSKYETGEILYKKIKKKYPEIQIIIITAKNSDDIHLTEDELFMTEIFYKPIDSKIIENLLFVINKKTKK